MNIAAAGHSAIIRAVATTVSARQRSQHYNIERTAAATIRNTWCVSPASTFWLRQSS